MSETTTSKLVTVSISVDAQKILNQFPIINPMFAPPYFDVRDFVTMTDDNNGQPDGPAYNLVTDVAPGDDLEWIAADNHETADIQFIGISGQVLGEQVLTNLNFIGNKVTCHVPESIGIEAKLKYTLNFVIKNDGKTYGPYTWDPFVFIRRSDADGAQGGESVTFP
ncbi:hypothetical protein FUAX_36410 [Fulvitalea axinellae]|uniref:Inclusion body protein n=1 Tax=Fulvitalea axinellae TaxID=1182444 RepID=A0AAU9D9G5_9BACT|nr:hypothetical protein FUAX_36410 [Fulvitalea axinellae]